MKGIESLIKYVMEVKGHTSQRGAMTPVKMNEDLTILVDGMNSSMITTKIGKTFATLHP